MACNCAGPCPGRGSQRAYARHRGVFHRAVQYALETGRIEVDPDGKIDFAKADAAWEANTDMSKPRSTAATRQRAGTATAPTTNGGDPARTAHGFAAARATREAYDARIRQLEYEKMKGTLINAEEVRVAWFSTARRARDLLMAIPDRISPILAGTVDAAEVHRMLSDEIRRVCQEIGEVAT